MWRRRKIVVFTALVALLVAMWLVFGRSAAQRSLGVGFTSAKAHFPESALVVADQITVAWVTNTCRCAINLGMPYVQFEDTAGRLMTDQGSSWNQEGYSATLPPGSVAWLASGFAAETKRLRFGFE